MPEHESEIPLRKHGRMTQTSQSISFFLFLSQPMIKAQAENCFSFVYILLLARYDVPKGVHVVSYHLGLVEFMVFTLLVGT